MQRIHVARLGVVVWLVAVAGVPVATAADIKACSMLTTADLEAALRQKVTQTGMDASGTLGDGPMKGATKYGCSWWVGGAPLGDNSTYVILTVVSRPPRTPEEVGAVSYTRGGEDEWKKGGGTVEVAKVTGGDCRAYKGKKGSVPTVCYVEAKGLGLVLDVTAPGGVPIAQVKPLVDKAVSRLP